MRLIGASRRAIFAPFLLEGWIQGAFGAALGLVALVLFMIPLQELISHVEVVSLMLPRVNLIPIWQMIGVVAVGIIV